MLGKGGDLPNLYACVDGSKYSSIVGDGCLELDGETMTSNHIFYPPFERLNHWN